jgi:hypothetical protein
MQTSDWIATWSFVVAVISLIAALISIYVAVYAIKKGNKNSSVATLVTLNEAFREAWQRLILSISSYQEHPENKDNRYANLAELINLTELGCAIHDESSLTGVSKNLVKQYLLDTLEIIISDDYLSKQIPDMLTDPTTFEHIRKFLKSQRSQPSKLIIPVEWYES